MIRVQNSTKRKNKTLRRIEMISYRRINTLVFFFGNILIEYAEKKKQIKITTFSWMIFKKK